jgi:hypothetical protein
VTEYLLQNIFLKMANICHKKFKEHVLKIDLTNGNPFSGFH